MNGVIATFEGERYFYYSAIEIFIICDSKEKCFYNSLIFLGLVEEPLSTSVGGVKKLRLVFIFDWYGIFEAERENGNRVFIIRLFPISYECPCDENLIDGDFGTKCNGNEEKEYVRFSHKK